MRVYIESVVLLCIWVGVILVGCDPPPKPGTVFAQVAKQTTAYDHDAIRAVSKGDGKFDINSPGAAGQYTVTVGSGGGTSAGSGGTTSSSHTGNGSNTIPDVDLTNADWLEFDWPGGTKRYMIPK